MLLAFGALTGCGDDDGTVTDAGVDDAAMVTDAGPTGPTELAFALETEGEFWGRPFPLESLRHPDGRPNYENYPKRNLDVIDDMARLAEGQGFSTTSPIYLPFTGPIVLDDTPTDPAAYRMADAPVLLIDIDENSPRRGSLTPLMLRVSPPAEERDSYRPPNVLQVLPAPGFNLREETLYAVVVRDSALRAGNTERPLRQSETLAALLSDSAPSGELGDATHGAFAPLREWLGTEGVATSEILAATVWRTGDVTSLTYSLADWARNQPAPTPSGDLTLVQEMPEYCAYQGTWQAPQFQVGEPPFGNGGGEMVIEDGVPVSQGDDNVPFIVAVPKGTMPAEGWPLLFYVNGTGGLVRQVVDRGVSVGEEPPEPGTGPSLIAARRGFGSSGMAGVMTPERVPNGGGGYLFYNFLNPAAMRDNFRQSLIEHIMYRRMLEGLAIDVSDCAGADVSASTDGMAHYDSDHFVIMGQSLGSYLSGMLATLDPGYEGAILTGAGGSWIEFAFGARSPDLTALARLALGILNGPFDRFHPGLAIFETAVAPSDNTHYADEILRDPTREGRRSDYSPPHVLVIEGDDDDNISTGLQRALNAALGTDLVGADVGAPEDQILPWLELAGRGSLPAPVSNNVMAGDEARTAAVVRWLPDRDDGGHYVTFQLEGPKHQYGCFLETLLETGIPVVVEGQGIDDSCD